MSETKALVATFVTMLSLVIGAWIGLTLVGAKDGVFVVVVLLIACAGALAISEVVARYAPPDERER